MNTISVIIPTCGRKQALMSCLNALINQRQYLNEVIVIDNTVDHTAKQIVAFYNHELPILYVYEPRKGSTWARNAGICKASSPIIAFLDDDCVPHPNWVSEIKKAFNSKSEDVIQGSNRNGYPQNLIASVEQASTEQFFKAYSYIRDRKRYLLALDTKNFAMRRSLITRHKFAFSSVFAPFSIFEDVDFSQQILEKRIQIRYCPSIIVSHYGRTSLFSHTVREWRKGRASVLLIKKWKINLNPIKDMIPHFVEKNNYRLQSIAKSIHNKTLHKKSFIFNLLFRIISHYSLIIMRMGMFVQKILIRLN